MVILKRFLPEKFYDHFLLLFCATTICSSSKYEPYFDIAQELFVHFVQAYKKIYGLQFITSNVHNLIHVVDDVKRFGALPTISTYPFENQLYKIKSKVKAGSNPLAQIGRRLVELTVAQRFNKVYLNETKSLKVKQVGFLCEIELAEFTLSNKKFSDMWFMVKNKDIICMKGVDNYDSKWFIKGQKLIHKQDFFETPIKSSYLNIFKASISFKNMGRVHQYDTDDIMCKLVPIEDRPDKMVFLPLLHTLT